MQSESKTRHRFLVCPECRGTGFSGNNFCAACRGYGVAMLFHEKIFYWGKYIDSAILTYEKAEEKVKVLLNLFLGLIGLSGLAVMAYFGYQDNFNSIFSWNYWLTPSHEKFYFWLTLLVDLYLYYRLEQESSPRRQVLADEYRFNKNVDEENLTWTDFPEIKKTEFIDIASAFNAAAMRAVEASWELARHFEHNEVGRTHLFGALPQFDKSAIVFARLGINFDQFKQKIGRFLSKYVISRPGNTLFSAKMHKILLTSYLFAYLNRQKKVDVTELLEALVSINDNNDKDGVDEILLDFDLNCQKVKNVVSWIRTQSQLREKLQRFRSRARYKPKSGLDRAMTGIATPLLDKFSEDMTLQAKFGNFFPCLGREKEFDRIFRIMEASRAGVLLIGHHGVGRTAILQGLAERMVAEDVPEILRDKRLVSLNLASLLAGTDAADAEERLLQVTSEIIRSGNIVLAVENLHNLTGITAGGESSLDLAEVFVQILNKHLFYCLATTAPDEYAKAIENRGLDAAFQKIKVEELELNDAVCVLEARSGPIEYQNNVYFSYAAIEKAAVLSSRYIHDRYLPEKAIEILEQAAIKVSQERGANQLVRGEDVADVLSQLTSIPLTQVTQKESEKLLNLEDKIHERLIAQDEAVSVVAAALRRARAELREGKRPIASLLFLGPTGVGKTELAKTVAEVYFGDEKSMIRVDMSEYQEGASVNRLIGTRADLGLLTEPVRKNPFALVLLDEIEKAHSDILNLFLQVMDDGRLTDGRGRVIDFTNTIIIMTSNAGANYVQDEIKKGASAEEIKNHLVNDELRQHFRPEFLNRFDGIVVFKPLAMVEVIKVTRLMLNKIAERLKDKGIEFSASDEAVAELAEFGFDPKFGARPLRRVIQDKVDDSLANYLLKNEISRRDKVVLDVGGKLRIEKAAEI